MGISLALSVVERVLRETSIDLACCGNFVFLPVHIFISYCVVREAYCVFG